LCCYKLGQVRLSIANFNMVQCICLAASTPHSVRLLVLSLLVAQQCTPRHTSGSAYRELTSAALALICVLSLQHNKQPRRALAAMQRALELDPRNVEAMVGVAILKMGSVDHQVRVCVAFTQ
jgi:hypothetical protein